MGKAALFLVSSMLITLSGYYAMGKEGEYFRTEAQNDYQTDVLARELAHSALNIAVAKTARDFSNFRETVAGQPYEYGMFGYDAVGDRQGPVAIRAQGMVGDAVHEIYAVLERSGSAVLDAITIDGPVSGVEARGNSFTISGRDEALPPDESGIVAVSGPDAHAIRTVLGTADDAFVSAMDASQVTGVGGELDIVSGPTAIDLDALDTAIRAHPDRIEIEGPEKITGNDVYGSRANPAIIIVSGDLDVRGSLTGYGILLVDGSITMGGTAYWEGLVVAHTDGGEHQFKGTADIRGALVLRSLTEIGESGGEEDAGLIGGHFDVDVFTGTGALRYHDHQYDDRYDVTGLNLLSAGCEDAGGLCWDELVTESGAGGIRISVENPSSADGTFYMQSIGSLFEGPMAEVVEFETTPSDIVAFNLSFDTACGMRGADPGAVWADGNTRDGTVTVRVENTDPEALGSPAVLLYEMSVYRHSLESECAETRHDGLVNEQVDVRPISFYMNGNVQVQSSYEALYRLGSLIPEMASSPVQIRMTSVSQKASRLDL